MTSTSIKTDATTEPFVGEDIRTSIAIGNLLHSKPGSRSKYYGFPSDELVRALPECAPDLVWKLFSRMAKNGELELWATTVTPDKGVKSASKRLESLIGTIEHLDEGGRNALIVHLDGPVAHAAGEEFEPFALGTSHVSAEKKVPYISIWIPLVGSRAEQVYLGAL